MIHLDDTITVRQNLMVADLDGETVLLDTESGYYFGLNSVGTRIWELASEARPLKEIVALLVNEYAVAEHQLEKDVLGFVNSLAQRCLIQVVEEVEA